MSNACRHDLSQVPRLLCTFGSHSDQTLSRHKETFTCKKRSHNTGRKGKREGYGKPDLTPLNPLSDPRRLCSIGLPCFQQPSCHWLSVCVSNLPSVSGSLNLITTSARSCCLSPESFPAPFATAGLTCRRCRSRSGTPLDYVLQGGRTPEMRRCGKRPFLLSTTNRRKGGHEVAERTLPFTDTVPIAAIE